jgi:hypothetical protein
MDLNGPRIEAEASGLGSNVSSWLTPPVIKIKIARWLAIAAMDEARAAPDNPTTVSPPARRKSRRETPSESVLISAADIRFSFFCHQSHIDIRMYHCKATKKTTSLKSTGTGPFLSPDTDGWRSLSAGWANLHRALILPVAPDKTITPKEGFKTS